MTKKIRVFEAFSGYGSQSIALKNLGIEHEVVAISEIDKYALQGYYSLHDKNILNLGDITKIKVEDIPQHDLFTYSFPCQDISVGGKTKGIIKGETRSGLLYECEKIIEYCKPKYLLMENVKNLVGKKFKEDFNKWLDYLEGLGYTNYWKILNAKDYGIPQNRERVFVVSILGKHDLYEFPSPVPLTIKLADILENEVEEKYYINKTKDYFIKHSFEMESKGNGFRFSPHVKQNAKVAKTITTRSGARMDDNFIIDLPLKVEKFEFSTKNPLLNTKKILIPQATKKGFIELEVPGICDMTYPKSQKRRGRVQEKGQICPTLTAARQEILYIDEIKEDFKIRKLTPKECFRLMGLNDSDIDKIQATGISNSQQYKMAGNSIVVQVLEGIFKNLFIGEKNKNE